MKQNSSLFVAAISIVVLGMSYAAEAAAPGAAADAASQRLELFGRAQRSCAVAILSSPDKGRALTGLKKRLGDFCECVAIYAVSQTTDENVQAILAADPEQNAVFVDRSLKAFGACTY